MRRVSIPLEGEPTSRKNIARPFALSKQGVVMVSAKGIIAAISVFAAAMLATDGATSAGLERIHPGEASFIFAAEEFSGATPVYMKDEDEFFGYRTDLGIFKAGGARSVVVYVQTTNDETVLGDAPTPKNLVDSFKFNKMSDKEWGRSSLVETHLGKFAVVAYRIASKIWECFGFSLEFDFDAHDNIEYRFTKHIYGYYCAQMGEQLSPDKITNLLRSISVAQTPKPGASRPRSDIKGILRATGLSDLEAFQEAKNYIGTKCLDNFERFEKWHSNGFETAFAYAQERLGDRYACGSSYSTIVEAAKYRALYKCERAREKHGVNAPCEILAIGNKIVWEGKTARSK